MRKICYCVNVDNTDVNHDWSNYNRSFETIQEAYDYARSISWASDYDQEEQDMVSGVWVTINLFRFDANDPSDTEELELHYQWVAFR
jgi:hypothetical protein